MTSREFIENNTSRADDGSPEEEEEDVYFQLAQKERDLTLAAELGKALLEKNEELERKQELMVEEYTQKLELRHELQTTQYQNFTGTRERSDAMRELARQNERLSEEMKHAELREDELSSQVQMLREQIGILTQKNIELERKIYSLTEERDALSCSLEESQEKILVLEKQNREKELQLQNQERDILELQETNMQLEAQLHHMSSNFLHPHHYSNHHGNQSQNLFSELSQMSSPSPPPEIANQTCSSGSDDGYNHHLALAEWMEDDDFECDDELQLATVGTDLEVPHGSTILSDSQFLSDFQCSSRMDTGDDMMDSCTEPDQDDDVFNMSELQGHIRELTSELQAAHSDLDRVKTELKERDSQLQEKSQELSQLTSKLQEQRDKLHMGTSSYYGRDDTVEKARRDRDKALEKQNKMEMELSKAKMDLLSLNNQLMEAIQQKVALSEQLDQWQ
ncbi:hypothetical protein KUTeg_010415, partial [Tegillarca granosa]